MEIKEIAPGRSIIFADEKIFDWYDRPIAAVGKVESNIYLFHALVAWAPSAKFGIRLYFPISNDIAFAWIRLQNWTDLQRAISSFVKDFAASFACTTESNPCEPIAVTWLEAIYLRTLNSNVMDIDSTMNNVDIDKWIELANS